MDLNDYDIPIDVIHHVILKHISYFELDNILPYFRLTPKEIAIIKFKIYIKKLKITKYYDRTEYKIEGKLHREGDLPAIEYADGDKYWYINGKLNREDDLPAIEYADGDKYWYINEQLHREDELLAYKMMVLENVE